MYLEPDLPAKSAFPSASTSQKVVRVVTALDPASRKVLGDRIMRKGLSSLTALLWLAIASQVSLITAVCTIKLRSALHPCTDFYLSRTGC